jgi:uncharacterized protein
MSKENVEICKRMAADFQAGERYSTLAYFDKDVIWDTTRSDQPQAGVYHGHEGIVAFFNDWFAAWESFDYRSFEWIDAGDAVVSKFWQRNTGRGSGVVVESEFYGVYEVREGKIVRFRLFSSWEEALEAAGLPPDEP